MLNIHISSLLCLGVIFLGTIIYGMRTRISAMGSDIEGKRKAFHKTQGNVFIVIGIILIIIAGISNLLNREAFLAFFTAGLTSLGFKLSFYYRDKQNKND